MAQEIYVLEESKVVSCRADVVAEREYEPIICEADPGHRSSWRHHGPITIDLDESDATECLWTWMSDCLLSQTIVQELASAGCTGFDTDEVRSVGKSRLGLTYKQFKQVGWGGVAGKESGIKQIYRCESCHHTRFSPLRRSDRLFDPEQWDGSDVFMIWPLTKFIFVTVRAADVLISMKVTGLNLVPVEDLVVHGDGFSAGRLSYYLSPERAGKIGASLGIA